MYLCKLLKTGVGVNSLKSSPLPSAWNVQICMEIIFAKCVPLYRGSFTSPCKEWVHEGLGKVPTQWVLCEVPMWRRFVKCPGCFAKLLWMEAKQTQTLFSNKPSSTFILVKYTMSIWSNYCNCFYCHCQVVYSWLSPTPSPWLLRMNQYLYRQRFLI